MLALSSIPLRLRVRLSHWSLDARLAAGVDSGSDRALAVRAKQLRSKTHRRRLASWLERLARESGSAGAAGPSSAAPIGSEQVAEAREALLLAVQVLRDSEPVRPRGIAMIEHLLRDGDSVLYAETVPGAAELQLRAALSYLVGSTMDAAPISASATPEGRPRLTQIAYR
jgi:hypothetical protein